MRAEVVPVNFKRRINGELMAIERDRRICKENKELIRAFLRDCFAEGLSHGRVAKYANLLKQIAIRLQKPFRIVDTNDIKGMLEKIELSNYSAWTKRDYRICLKKFWPWLEGTDEYPPTVR
jgi:site-specific recombinase XerD